MLKLTTLDPLLLRDRSGARAGRAAERRIGAHGRVLIGFMSTLRVFAGAFLDDLGSPGVA